MGGGAPPAPWHQARSAAPAAAVASIDAGEEDEASDEPRPSADSLVAMEN